MLNAKAQRCEEAKGLMATVWVGCKSFTMRLGQFYGCMKVLGCVLMWVHQVADLRPSVQVKSRCDFGQ